MKLNLDALRTRQGLRIRVPAAQPSFVNALQTGSFATWVHFRKVRRQPLLPIREGLPVTRAAAAIFPAQVFPGLRLPIIRMTGASGA
jgi:hypothetical protein